MAGTALHQKLYELSSAFWISRSLQIVAEMGIADALSDTPQSAQQLAQATGANADALHRILRLLASLGIFQFKDGAWEHTPESRLLREDHPHSVRGFVRLTGLPIFWKSWEHAEHALRTGEAAVTQLDPGGAFAYLAKHPEESRIFNEGMAAKAQRDIPDILRAYDFSAFKTIADIGGGRGHLLLSILQVARQSAGIVFDQSHVIAEAAPTDARLQHCGGDFFAGPLPAADVYLLMDVLHDWNNADSARILASIRRAAPPHAKLLVIEAIIPSLPGPHLAKALDVNMLIMTGGRERTVEEHRELLEAAGFALERTLPTPGPYSILEAKAV